MTLRARFFDDWRLSRIDEEMSDRLSVSSETSVLDPATAASAAAAASSLAAVQRSASADGTLETTGGESGDERETSQFPSPLVRKKDDIVTIQQMDELALRFMQVKYDTLGRVRVDKGRIPDGGKAADVEVCRVTVTEMDERISVVGRTSTSRERTPTEKSTPFYANTAGLQMMLSSSSTKVHPTEVCCYLQQNECGQYNVRQHHHQQQTQAHHCGLRHDQAQQPCSTPTNDVIAGVGPCHNRLQDERREFLNQQQQKSDGRLDDDDKQDRSQKKHVGASQAPSTTKKSAPLTNAEIFQVDLFYRSRTTLVHVCPCAATLFFSSSSSTGRCPPPPQSATERVTSPDSWHPVTSGVPVAVLETAPPPAASGSPVNGRRLVPRLHLILAERGTGFELWRHVIDNVEQYSADVKSGGTAASTADAAAFHTVLLPPNSNRCSRLAGLQYDDGLAAVEFHRQLVRMGRLDDAELCSLMGLGRKAKKWVSRSKPSKGGASNSPKHKLKSKPTFSKADISQPCCFTHVTRIERDGVAGQQWSVPAVNGVTSSRHADSFASARPIGWSSFKLHS